MKIVIAILIALVFLFFGYLLGRLKQRSGSPDGLLNVDVRDPDKDYYDFVFLIPTTEIPKKRFLKIEVFVKGKNTQGEES